MFDVMLKQKDPSPDVKTYAIMMNACNHCGDAERAQSIWSQAQMDGQDDVLSDKYVVSAFVDCMARKGCLEETYTHLMEHAIIFEEAWSSLLAACRKHDNMEVAEKVLDRMKNLNIDSERMGSACTTMSHIYATHSM